MATSIKTGADATVLDTTGSTALHCLLYEPNEASVRMLLNSGTDITVRNISGEKALYYATSRYLKTPRGLRTHVLQQIKEDLSLALAQAELEEAGTDGHPSFSAPEPGKTSKPEVSLLRVRK